MRGGCRVRVVVLNRRAARALARRSTRAYRARAFGARHRRARRLLGRRYHVPVCSRWRATTRPSRPLPWSPRTGASSEGEPCAWLPRRPGSRRPNRSLRYRATRTEIGEPLRNAQESLVPRIVVIGGGFRPPDTQQPPGWDQPRVSSSTLRFPDDGRAGRSDRRVSGQLRLACGSSVR